MIPPGGQISFQDIADKTGLEKREVRRLVTNATSMRIMKTTEPEMVAHTKVSKFMTIPYIKSWIEFEGKDTWPAATKVSVQECLASWRKECWSELTQTRCGRLQTRFRNGQTPKKPARL